MSNKIHYCLLCQRYDGRTKRSNYTRIGTIEREEKLREGYRLRYNGHEIDQPLFNQLVHQKCYNKTVEYIPSVDQAIPITDILSSTEPNQNEEQQDQESIVQSRSRVVLPKNARYLLERSQRICIVCHTYKTSRTNRMKQVTSNFMAKKLAEGFLHRYKRLYEKSLLDAYIHDACYRKLYSSYRSRLASKANNTHRFRYHKGMTSQSYIPPDQRSNLSTAEITIEDLLSTPLSASMGAMNPNIELSARSCLFLPCLQRLTPEEIESYTKRKSTTKELDQENPLISCHFSSTESSITQPLTKIDPMISICPSNDLDINEENQPPSYSTINKPATISRIAEIRSRPSKYSNLLPDGHNYNPNLPTQTSSDELEKLYQWLINQLKSSEHPVLMSDALTKYKEFTEENTLTPVGKSLGRVQLRNRLEKYYPNEFLFIVPNKHDGTFIALNDIDYYVRFAIKRAQQDRIKATETSILSSVIVPPTSKDYKRETCEAIMNGIRKIRHYIRDPKEVDESPSLLMQNLIGLITASERQFNRIALNYDFYRMIDENLFDQHQKKPSNKLDKTVRNKSLASDLISARHDRQISQKHYLLADELSTESFHCTPRQVITLLNRYGHTCSYKSYRRMKTFVQETTSELGERISIDTEKASDLELDLMDL